MKSHVRFTETIKVESVPFSAGDIVPVDKLNPGCLHSLLRLGRVVECDPPPVAKPNPPVLKPPGASPPVAEVKKPEPIPAKPEVKK